MGNKYSAYSDFKGMKCEGCGRTHGDTNGLDQSAVILSVINVGGGRTLRCYPCGIKFLQARKDAAITAEHEAPEVDPNQTVLL